MGGRRRGWRSWVALGAGCALVLQALIVDLGRPAHAAPHGLDAFTGVICTPDGIRQLPDPSHLPADPHGNGCCTLGCVAGGAGVPPPSVSAAAVPERAVDDTVLRARGSGDRLKATLEQSPRSTRAPPRPV